MALENLGFEDAGLTAGLADLWTTTVTTAAERVAVWGTGDPPLDEDSFEEEWNNDDYLFELELADTAPPVLDTDVSEGEAEEDFEEGWSGNQGYSFELGSAEAASFDAALTPEAEEDFEEGWDANEDYETTLGTSTAASFDAALTPQTVEDFEDGWSGTGAGNDYLTSIGSSTAASFDGVSPEDVEDFEEVQTERPVVVDPSTNLFTALSAHGFVVGDRCSFRLLGSGALPAGINSGYSYFVIASGLTTVEFRVAVTAGGTQIDVTDAGVGTFVVVHDRAEYWVVKYS